MEQHCTTEEKVEETDEPTHFVRYAFFNLRCCSENVTSVWHENKEQDGSDCNNKKMLKYNDVMETLNEKLH